MLSLLSAMCSTPPLPTELLCALRSQVRPGGHRSQTPSGLSRMPVAFEEHSGEMQQEQQCGWAGSTHRGFLSSGEVLQLMTR